MKYRKKPVVVEAFQMTKEQRVDNSDWPEWLCAAWHKRPDEVGAAYPEIPGHRVNIHTLEGVMVVSLNDYIIQGVKGEIYPCKPDIFEATYEPVED